MPDQPAEPIVLQPQVHSDQLLRPPAAPSPQVATPPATVPPAPTIAVDGSTHADVVKAIEDGRKWFDGLTHSEKVSVYYELLDKGMII